MSGDGDVRATGASTDQADDERSRVGADTPQASPRTAAEQAAAAEGQPDRARQEDAPSKQAEKDESEGGAAGHGAEPRGRRTDKGEATYLIAVAEALWEEMERDERVFLLGEDIGVYGGAFKVTEGFIERFGPQRVWDTPIMEETIVGMSVGAAMEGFRPVAEFQYADFMTCGFDEIVATAAKYTYRSGVPLPMVLRGPSGGGVRASAFHSQNPEPLFAHVGGMKVICPAFPTDAKGLLKAAIRDDNPVVFLEHKWIYRRIKEQVPEDPDFVLPIGKAEVKRAGDDVSIITYGAMVHKALEAAEDLAEQGISAEVVDLRTVYPLDTEAIVESVAKTSHALVLYESLKFLGIGSEVSAVIAEEAFEHLDAPVMRLAPPNHAVPFSPPLEDAFLPQVDDIVAAVDRLSKW
ncbi:MAG TPA: alpha-ketoacid dehydrogenase subunit beta [Actinomycetota bacterium]|nr:alpha-ketoacid dehydrogenase subunit beta [Actinomycetota bacterium]